MRASDGGSSGLELGFAGARRGESMGVGGSAWELGFAGMARRVAIRGSDALERGFTAIGAASG